MGCSFNGADRGHCITGDCPKHDGPRCHWHDVGQVHARKSQPRRHRRLQRAGELSANQKCRSLH
ncbi:Os10g0501100 [Oryza sativa Japonica Group]|uniref:Os10g0501100 protein n=1 Tax=Oryza sativa subsp. japonica TaxID=39947 RepID=A0A0P0XWI0_ORYSJ|nr:Os10g0501100 [Oryza sativa Japonica Group]